MKKQFTKEVGRCGECPLYHSHIVGRCPALEKDVFRNKDEIDPDCPLPDVGHWSEDAPTEAGSYWAVEMNSKFPEIVEIELSPIQDEGFILFFNGESAPFKLDEIKLWHHPAIPMPPEPGGDESKERGRGDG